MAKADELIHSALKYVGYPTVHHNAVKHDPFNLGNNSRGFDCSGFIQYLLYTQGFDLFHPVLNRNIRYAREFFDFFGVSVQTGYPQKGDLVFFSHCSAMPTHVALYLGENKLIHKGAVDNSIVPPEEQSKYPQLIIVSDLEEIANDARKAGNPINYRPRRGIQRYYKNPIGFKRFLFD